MAEFACHCRGVTLYFSNIMLACRLICKKKKLGGQYQGIDTLLTTKAFWKFCPIS